MKHRQIQQFDVGPPHRRKLITCKIYDYRLFLISNDIQPFYEFCVYIKGKIMVKIYL